MITDQISIHFLPMKNYFISPVLIFLNVVLAVFFILFLIQRDFYFLKIESSLENLDQHKTIKLLGEDKNPIDLRFIDNKADIDLFLMLGNNTEEDMYNTIAKQMKSHKKHCNIFTLFFRGSLGNPGKPTEKSITEDIKVIGEFLKKRNKKTYGFGFSFGCSPILKLANFTKFDTIILANPFTSLKDVVKTISFFGSFSIFLVDKFDNINQIKKLSDTKIQIFTSENDRNIPPKHSEVLKKNNNSAKQEVLPGINHFGILFESTLEKILYNYIDFPASGSTA